MLGGKMHLGLDTIPCSRSGGLCLDWQKTSKDWWWPCTLGSCQLAGLHGGMQGWYLLGGGTDFWIWEDWHSMFSNNDKGKGEPNFSPVHHLPWSYNQLWTPPPNQIVPHIWHKLCPKSLLPNHCRPTQVIWGETQGYHGRISSRKKGEQSMHMN